MKESKGGHAGDKTLATKGSGKGGHKGKGDGKGTGKGPKGGNQSKDKSQKPPGTLCPFFKKNGSCRKGADCDMVH